MTQGKNNLPSATSKSSIPRMQTRTFALLTNTRSSFAPFPISSSAPFLPYHLGLFQVVPPLQERFQLHWPIYHNQKVWWLDTHTYGNIDLKTGHDHWHTRPRAGDGYHNSPPGLRKRCQKVSFRDVAPVPRYSCKDWQRVLHKLPLPHEPISFYLDLPSRKVWIFY